VTVNFARSESCTYNGSVLSAFGIQPLIPRYARMQLQMLMRNVTWPLVCEQSLVG